MENYTNNELKVNRLLIIQEFLRKIAMNIETEVLLFLAQDKLYKTSNAYWEVTNTFANAQTEILKWQEQAHINE